MVVALEPSYYLTAGDVENVVKNSRDFSITETDTSYHDLFVQAVSVPDDKAFEPTLTDMDGWQYHPIRMYSSTPTGRTLEINRLLNRLHWYHNLGAHANILRMESLYAREKQPLALVFRRRLISLRSYIEANPEANRRQFCIALANGIDFLHSNGFAHGRIRLSSMFIDPETGVSVLGMPSERSIPNGTTLREYSKWASPELANSDTFRRMPVDHYRDTYHGEYRPDSDIYALACTIIEIYTGQTPGTYHINAVRDSLSGSGFMPGTINIAAIPQDIMQTLMLMMNLDPGRRLNSGLVVQHLSNAKLVHVTNFQPALAKYQARRFMRRADTVLDNDVDGRGATDFLWSESASAALAAPVVEDDPDAESLLYNSVSAALAARSISWHSDSSFTGSETTEYGSTYRYTALCDTPSSDDAPIQ